VSSSSKVMYPRKRKYIFKGDVMEKYHVRIKNADGSALLQHRFAGSAKTSAKKKGSVYDPDEEAQAALYLDEDGNHVEPASHIEGALVKAGATFKYQGRKTYKDMFRASLFVEPELIPLKSDGYEVDTRPAVVMRARIMRSRPIFKEWELEFTITNIADDQVAGKSIKEILEYAGTSVGIGDFRPKFGRFTVEEFKQIDA